MGRFKNKRSQSFTAKINISIKSNTLLWQLFFNWQWLKSHRNLIRKQISLMLYDVKKLYSTARLYFSLQWIIKKPLYKCMCWVSLEQPRHRCSSEGAHYRARVELWDDELHSHVRCVELNRRERHWHLCLAVSWDDACK